MAYNIVFKHVCRLWINGVYRMGHFLSTDYKQDVSLAMLGISRGKTLNLITI